MVIDKYDLISIETGSFALDGGAMFGVVPKNLWEKSNPADEANRIDLSMRTLLLSSAKRKVLIDTGIGDKFNKKFSTIYKTDFSKNELLTSLNNVGINRYDITDVILSHLHFDHCGGSTHSTAGKIELTFPNATYHVQKEQWLWANNPSEKDRASFIPENFHIIETSGHLNLLNGPGKIFSCVESFVMNGHTPGMQLIKISDQENTVLYCSDLIPTASHIPVPWVMAYDNNPIVTISEKQKLLPMATQEKWVLFFEHDPFRVAGIVKETERGYVLDQEIVASTFNKK